MSTLHKRLSEKVDQRKKSNAFRQLYGPSKGVDFCSNDYLGLAQTPEIYQQTNNTLQKIGLPLGATGSRLISGNHSLYDRVEKQLCSFHRSESALIFNSGYDANIGFFSTIPQRGDTIIYDSLCHASIRDGIRLSVAKGYSFPHNDIDALRSKLELARGAIFIAVESVYSMDGDIAPLEELAQLCEEFQAYLVVDEAHSTGIYGKYGEGLVVSLGLEGSVFARLHTFGKAIGAHGAAWFGPPLLRDYLINYCRSFIYTTALPVHSLGHIESAYTFLGENPQRIQDLQLNIIYFKQQVTTMGIGEFIYSDSPIQSCIISGNEKVKSVATFIQENGFDVRPILHPTVGLGQERLRVCIHSFNSETEITELVQMLKMGIDKFS
ncbi:MAG: 8-amino-7-oxononanoate synthase [Candidatus Marinimicrobia bacterium]|nr:8-amino-7-oxononanoate synthase [Candidatus Neomarinimicrobiota bacterium]